MLDTVGREESANDWTVTIEVPENLAVRSLRFRTTDTHVARALKKMRSVACLRLAILRVRGVAILRVTDAVCVDVFSVGTNRLRIVPLRAD